MEEIHGVAALGVPTFVSNSQPVVGRSPFALSLDDRSRRSVSGSVVRFWIGMGLATGHGRSAQSHALVAGRHPRATSEADGRTGRAALTRDSASHDEVLVGVGQSTITRDMPSVWDGQLGTESSVPLKLTSRKAGGVVGR